MSVSVNHSLRPSVFAEVVCCAMAPLTHSLPDAADNDVRSDIDVPLLPVHTGPRGGGIAGVWRIPISSFGWF